MAGKYSNTEYTRFYKDFRGVDLCGKGASIDRSRLAAAINMYKDYEAEGAPVVESIPGYRRIASLGAPIGAIYRYGGADGGDTLLAVAGRELYRISVGTMESEEPTHLCTLPSEKSCGFAYGSAFYLLSGYRMFRIDGYGEVTELGMEGMEPYVPTLYLNGELYEQRNLLTDGFAEEVLVGSAEDYMLGTRGLTYEITDADNRLLAVTGAEGELTGELSIPSRVRLGESLYRVEKIADNAFAGQTGITSVRIGEGVKEIGIFAFDDCNYITEIVTPSSLQYIGNAAFTDCARMTDLYLGLGLRELGLGVFGGCISLDRVHYEGDADSYALIKNISMTDGYEKLYGSRSTACTAEFTLRSRAIDIKAVKVNGISRPYEAVYGEGEPVRIIMPLESAGIITGARIRIEGVLSPLPAQSDGDFLCTEGGRLVGAIDAVLGCTVAECFDGRVFYSGNAALPNTVFYTARGRDGIADPTYVGSFNYFNDGVGSYPVKAMLSVRDSLAVFKAGDDGTGSIFYHYGKDTDSGAVPRIYPVSYVHSGICAVGGAINFLDDPVFISSLGLSALDRHAISYERSVVTRSHNVSYELLREEGLHSTSLTEWEGYLVLGIGSHAYLADSRATFRHDTGGTEYEWFYLAGIGEWQGSERVYRYSSHSDTGLAVHPYPDTVCSEQILEGADGVLYCTVGGVNYAVEPTEELTGGVFYPATVYLGVGRLLFFGTEGGGIMVFNSDKRGIPPKELTDLPDFDPEEYRRRMGRRIHPAFYSFDGHAAEYLVTTAMDDCGIPNMTKSTVPRSTVLKCKSFTSSSVSVDVATDISGYSELCELSPGELSFHEMDFSRLSLTSGEFFSIPIGEREKGWLEKQYTVYSCTFRHPIGICSLTYRFTLKGDLKKR